MPKRKEHKFIDGVEYKHCSKCDEWKILNEFLNDSSKWDKKHSRCQNCNKNIAKKYRLENKNKYNEYYLKIKDARKQYKIINRKKIQQWWNSPNGKMSKRKSYAKRKSCYIIWNKNIDINILYLFDSKCPYCGATKNLELEHWEPIAKGGQTRPGNCYYACHICNRNKHDKMPLDWLIERFGQDKGTEKYNYIVSILYRHAQMYSQIDNK